MATAPLAVQVRTPLVMPQRIVPEMPLTLEMPAVPYVMVAPPGRVSVKMVWPFAKFAGAVPPLATRIVQVQLPADSGTLPPTLFVFAAVRSGHVTAIGLTDTVGPGVVSTVALAVPARQVPSWVKVAVAVPVAWIVACAPEMAPCVAPNAIGRPSSTAMSAGTTAVASDLCRKSAVRALVPFGATVAGARAERQHEPRVER